MRKNLISVMLASVSIVAASAAYASDGTITINGSVVSSTCKINGGQGDVTVNLPKVATTALPAPGTVAGRTPFTLALTNCTTGNGNPTKVGVAFEAGANVDQATGRLTLDAGTEAAPAASNVEINVLNDRQQPIKVGFQGDQGSQMVAIGGDGSATLNYFAEYYANGAVTAGAANSKVQYSLTYQ
ncbi:type 1 fimbrial protein [Burkholderia sp. Tr-20390]|uniref:fimbrial protein n=1 Tax=Burkholderia sp. Tr-20390 TaxID=2703904 RepID=UPI001F1231EC|nr:type 1 fimbrial protein [Burkholderia sp. Tr-20390]